VSRPTWAFLSRPSPEIQRFPQQPATGMPLDAPNPTEGPLGIPMFFAENQLRRARLSKIDRFGRAKCGKNASRHWGNSPPHIMQNLRVRYSVLLGHATNVKTHTTPSGNRDPGWKSLLSTLPSPQAPYPRCTNVAQPDQHCKRGVRMGAIVLVVGTAGEQPPMRASREGVSTLPVQSRRTLQTSQAFGRRLSEFCKREEKPLGIADVEATFRTG